MGFQVALEIQDFEFILFCQIQQFTQSRISLDDLLVHQAVIFGVFADACCDFRTAQRCAFCNTQECAEGVRDRCGFCKDCVFLGFIRTTFCRSRLATTTLLSTLEFTWDGFFQFLHAGEYRAEC